MCSQAHLGYISKKSHDLEYWWNDTPNSLICNLQLERFKFNKLYIFRIYKR